MYDFCSIGYGGPISHENGITRGVNYPKISSAMQVPIMKNTPRDMNNIGKKCRLPLIGLCKAKRPFWSAHLNIPEFKFSDEVLSGVSPTVWNCQWKEWTLCWSMSSMRPHSKWSTYKKVLVGSQIFRWSVLMDLPIWNGQWKGGNSSLIYVVNETPFKMVNL